MSKHALLNLKKKQVKDKDKCEALSSILSLYHSGFN